MHHQTFYELEENISGHQSSNRCKFVPFCDAVASLFFFFLWRKNAVGRESPRSLASHLFLSLSRETHEVPQHVFALVSFIKRHSYGAVDFSNHLHSDNRISTQMSSAIVVSHRWNTARWPLAQKNWVEVSVVYLLWRRVGRRWLDNYSIVSNLFLFLASATVHPFYSSCYLSSSKSITVNHVAAGPPLPRPSSIIIT